MQSNVIRVASSFAVIAVCVGANAFAQGYPAKYVRIITGNPGSMTDVVTRRLAQRLGEPWAQSVVVENQGGAGITVGTGMAARAAPDGYTLLLADRTSIAVAPNLHKTLSYDPARDLAPIALVASAPLLLFAHPSVPAASLSDFIAYAKRLPQPLAYATAGIGTANHLPGEQLKQLAGIDLTAVHYKGGAPAMMAVLAGEVKAGFNLLPIALPHVKAGKVTAYVITTKKRFTGAPDIPTVVEAGLPDLEADYWVGLFAPARTPPAIIAKINRDVVETLQSSAMRSWLLDQGAEPAPGTPEQFAAFIKSETVKWGKVIKTAGIKPE